MDITVSDEVSQEYHALVKNILCNREFLKLSLYTHHQWTTRLMHSINVSYLSWFIARKLGCDEKAAARAGLVVDEWNGNEPHYVDENSEMQCPLLSVYTELTNKNGHCIAIGGGTYVHNVDGGVAFGAEFPGTESRMHGADEFISLEHLTLSAKIYAEAILRLCL